MGVRRRRRVLRHPGLLRARRGVPLQAARARLPLPLPEPVPVPALRGAAAAPGGARRSRGRLEHRRARRQDRGGAGRVPRHAAPHRLGGSGRPRRPAPPARQDQLPPARRPGLSHAGAPGPHAVRRGGAAHQPRQPARRPARRHALRPRRAVHRPSRPRHGAARRALPRARRPRQYRGHRRARPIADRGGRLRHRDGPGIGRARRDDGVRGNPGGAARRSPLAHRALSERTGEHSRCRSRAARAAAPSPSPARAPTT